VLPIVIDALQAVSIAAGRQEERPERPLTHDLMLSMLSMLDAKVTKVEVTDLVDGTYYAMVVLERHGMRFDVDARPSDALALAVRTKCPIFVAEHVLEASGLSTTWADPAASRPGAPHLRGCGPLRGGAPGGGERRSSRSGISAPGATARSTGAGRPRAGSR
jgi:uncharacterized protein